MTYIEYKNQKQNEFNNLPIFYAFSNEQLEKALNDRGLTINDTDKIYRLGDTGGFYLKSDAEIIRDYMQNYNEEELHHLMESDEKFAKDAFNYEMSNHEYAYNWQGDYDVCSCFGSPEYAEYKTGADYLNEMGYSDMIIAIYQACANKMIMM